MKQMMNILGIAAIYPGLLILVIALTPQSGYDKRVSVGGAILYMRSGHLIADRSILTGYGHMTVVDYRKPTSTEVAAYNAAN